ncbi:MAG TPA: Asp23/Gls24 family envelope stress response protein [Candidatus Atribacteria bacterium]|nr:Asp23/Gls24 family envelope stress response protein [Candidatus Atribacteria bacterium]
MNEERQDFPVGQENQSTEVQLNQAGSEEVLGEITIAPEIIATLAAITTMKVPGVTGMAGLPQASLGTLIGKRELNKGVKVDVKEKSVNLEISIAVDIEATIIEVARKVQQEVKQVIESKTGMKVNRIDINVREITYPEKEEEPAES